MRWQTLLRVPVEPFFSKEAKVEAETINSGIETLEKNRAQVEKVLQEVKCEDLAKFDFDNLIGVQWVRSHFATVLQVELVLRERIAEAMPKLQTEFRRGYDQAFKKHETAQTEVRKGLVEIGYLDEPVAFGNQGAIRPGWIMEHPKVRAAKAVRDRLQNFQLPIRENDEARQEVKLQLERLRAEFTKT